MKCNESKNRDLANAVTHLGRIRRQFLESVSMVMLGIAVIGMPLSLMRIRNTGLDPIHIAHVLISSVIIGVFFLRRKLSDRWLLSTLLGISSSISLVGFLQYGIVSGGFYFAAVSIFVGGIFLGLKKGILWAVIHLSAILVIASLWETGVLRFSMDANKYITLPSVWMLLTISFIITTGVYFLSASAFYSNLEELVDTINRQKQELEVQSAELVSANQSLNEYNWKLSELIANREQELQMAMAETLTASESEARRIGENIHDDLCQDLVALSQMAGSIHLPEHDCCRTCTLSFERIQREAGRLAKAARNYSHDLAFYELDAQSLPEALETLIRRNEEFYPSHIEINMDCDLPQLEAKTNNHLYRITRELISNANNHARAKNIWVDIVDDSKQLSVSVSNDGSPLPDSVIPGLGCRQIEMRTKILKGSFKLERAEDGKTVAELTCPLSGKEFS